MTPLAGVRVVGQLRFSRKEVVERLRNIFGHPHELRHRVVIGLYGVAETERERCRGALDEVFRREQLSSSKLRLDVGE